MRLHGLLDDARNGDERDFLVQIGRHGHFVGRIQDNRMAGARLQRTVGQPEAGKTIQIGLVKVEPACRRQVAARNRRRNSRSSRFSMPII